MTKQIQTLVDKYGKADFQLVGEDGNAYSIMARVGRALAEQGWPLEAKNKVIDEMMAGDYNHLLRVGVSVQLDELGSFGAYHDDDYWDEDLTI